MPLLWLALGFTWLAFAFVLWLQFQIMRQSGALLARMEALESRPPLEHASPEEVDPAPLQAVVARNGNRSDAVPHAEPVDHGLPVGTPAPDFDLPDLQGRRHTLADWRGKPVLIVFFSPRCGFCTEIAPDLAAMDPLGAGGRPVPVIITNGTVEENREWIEQYGIRCTVLLQDGMEVANRYNATGTPMGYLLDGEGKTASRMAVGGPPIVDLVPPPAGVVKKSISESKIARDGLRAGTPAPDFDLPNLTGPQDARVSLRQYRGRRVLLVFTDPQCGPCLELAPQLEALHRKGFGADLVMVTRGDEAANRAKARENRFTFPVALQKQWEVSKLYAMFATPVAYLVNEEGVISEEIAVGVDAILALAKWASRKEVVTQ